MSRRLPTHRMASAPMNRKPTRRSGREGLSDGVYWPPGRTDILYPESNDATSKRLSARAERRPAHHYDADAASVTFLVCLQPEVSNTGSLPRNIQGWGGPRSSGLVVLALAAQEFSAFPPACFPLPMPGGRPPYGCPTGVTMAQRSGDTS
ncbi:hypothetical protein BC827DRAFT_1198601 [Russula dissimulans]|nr:hypothetical protein BC827DRAFT_1198601 [Russula dissimulans]